MPVHVDFSLSAKGLVLGPRHVGLRFHDNRLGAVAYAELSPDEPPPRTDWLTVWPVSTEVADDQDTNRLVQALLAAGLLELPARGARRLIAEGLRGHEATDDDAAVALLSHAGTPRFVAREDVRETDLADTLEAALEGTPMTATRVDDETLRIHLRDAPSTDDDDEYDALDDDSVIFVRDDALVMNVMGAVNRCLAAAGQDFRFVRLHASNEGAAYARLTEPAKELLREAGITFVDDDD